MSMIPVGITMPPPRDRIADLEQENRTLRAKVLELTTSLQREEERANEMHRSASSLQAALSPLYRALQQIFGDLSIMDAETMPAVPRTPQNSAAWDSWKQRMPGATATIIDLLLLHGSLNQEQMRIHLGTKRKQTVYDACSKLNKAGLVIKEGDKFRLKEL